jgi:hypothetical protein
MIAMMPRDGQFDQGPGLPQPASQAGAAIRDDCRAARIGEVTDFAECLVKTDASCTHRFAFNAFRYCAHPQREAIIARTLAHEGPPDK